jgi:hypothetical protein
MVTRRHKDKQVVFISHAHEDEDFAKAIGDWLNANLNLLHESIEFFVSSNSSPGTEWPRKVLTKLEQVDVMLCLLSPNTLDFSRWVYFEAGAATMKKKEDSKNKDENIKVIPVCIGGVCVGDLLAPLDGHIAVVLQNLNEEDDRKEEKKLLETVALETGLKKPPDPKPLELPPIDHTKRARPFFTETQLALYEKSFTGRAIWVVSANLDHDMINGTLANIVAGNIERCIAYTYVLPDEPKVAVKKEGLENTYGKAGRPPKFVDVPPDLFDFDNITETNITIFNPVPYIKAPPSDVFVELPTHIDASNRYWVKVHPHFGIESLER